MLEKSSLCLLKIFRIVVTCRGTIDDFKAKTCVEISITTCVNGRWGDLLVLITTFPTKSNSFCLNDRQRAVYFLFYYLFSIQKSRLIFKASTLFISMFNVACRKFLRLASCCTPNCHVANCHLSAGCKLLRSKLSYIILQVENYHVGKRCMS